MRALIIAITVGALGSGCGAKDPCSSESGTCVTLLLDGNVMLDQLSLSVGAPIDRSVVTPNPPRKINLPAQVALVFPTGTSGTAELSIDALNQGVIVAHDERTITVGGHSTVSATLTAGTMPPPDLAGGSSDDLAGADLSGTIADLSGTIADLSGTIADLSTLADLSCSANTATDPANCGACGHDCLNHAAGACSGGVCQPFTLATLGSVGNHMATDGTNLYLRDSFNIYKCDLPLCAAGKQSIATTVTGGGNFGAVFVDASHSYLYIGEFSSTAGDLRRCALPACASWQNISTVNPGDVFYIYADANNMFWSDNTTIKGCSSGVIPCATFRQSGSLGSGGVGWLNSDGTNIYYAMNAGGTSGGGTIGSCTYPACASGSNIVTGLTNPIVLKLVGTTLYWLNLQAGTLSNCVLGSSCTTAGYNSYLSGMLTANTQGGFAVDASNIYVGQRSDGKLLGSCTAPNCGGTFTLAQPAADAPNGLIMTANAFYWLAGSGAVKGVAR